MISTSKLLIGKVVLITGCNRGIGKAMAERFAEEGAIVYVNSRKLSSLDSFSQELSIKYSTSIIPIYFDVNDSLAVKQAFIRINLEQKRLDCLINNAGIMQDALIGMITKTSLQEHFNTNVFAVVDLIQFAYKLMRKQKSGSIINISSIVGVEGSIGQMAYSATKGAVISITKTASKELAPNNIRVNAIAPGVINTDLLLNVNQVKMASIKSKIGIGRIGAPEDVANLAVFLASDLSSYITGQIIGVDGSWNI
jgi:3-oxoacyl-[acyl-carrier protein] reductase